MDALIKRSLQTFAQELFVSLWYRRERELVSLFVFRHLLPLCGHTGELTDPAQIGIEVGVPQLPATPGTQRKQVVCKDVVIWPQPGMTCWDHAGLVCHYPAAILEWKSINRHDAPGVQRRKLREHQADIAWLRETAQLASNLIGYAILIQQEHPHASLQYVRVSRDREESERFAPLSST